jgi:hypothetical protein
MEAIPVQSIDNLHTETPPRNGSIAREKGERERERQHERERERDREVKARLYSRNT